MSGLVSQNNLLLCGMQSNTASRFSLLISVKFAVRAGQCLNNNNKKKKTTIKQNTVVSFCIVNVYNICSVITSRFSAMHCTTPEYEPLSLNRLKDWIKVRRSEKGYRLPAFLLNVCP